MAASSALARSADVLARRSPLRKPLCSGTGRAARRSVAAFSTPPQRRDPPTLGPGEVRPGGLVERNARKSRRSASVCADSAALRALSATTRAAAKAASAFRRCPSRRWAIVLDFLFHPRSFRVCRGELRHAPRAWVSAGPPGNSASAASLAALAASSLDRRAPQPLLRDTVSGLRVGRLRARRVQRLRAPLPSLPQGAGRVSAERGDFLQQRLRRRASPNAARHVRSRSAAARCASSASADAASCSCSVASSVFFAAISDSNVRASASRASSSPRSAAPAAASRGANSVVHRCSSARRVSCASRLPPRTCRRATSAISRSRLVFASSSRACSTAMGSAAVPSLCDSQLQRTQGTDGQDQADIHRSPRRCQFVLEPPHHADDVRWRQLPSWSAAPPDSVTRSTAHRPWTCTTLARSHGGVGHLKVRSARCEAPARCREERAAALRFERSSPSSAALGEQLPPDGRVPRSTAGALPRRRARLPPSSTPRPPARCAARRRPPLSPPRQVESPATGARPCPPRRHRRTAIPGRAAPRRAERSPAQVLAVRPWTASSATVLPSASCSTECPAAAMSRSIC